MQVVLWLEACLYFLNLFFSCSAEGNGLVEQTIVVVAVVAQPVAVPVAAAAVVVAAVAVVVVGVEVVVAAVAVVVVGVEVVAVEVVVAAVAVVVVGVEVVAVEEDGNNNKKNSNLYSTRLCFYKSYI